MRREEQRYVGDRIRRGRSAFMSLRGAVRCEGVCRGKRGVPPGESKTVEGEGAADENKKRVK